jgi:hypothetical protein
VKDPVSSIALPSGTGAANNLRLIYEIRVCDVGNAFRRSACGIWARYRLISGHGIDHLFYLSRSGRGG